MNNPQPSDRGRLPAIPPSMPPAVICRMAACTLMLAPMGAAHGGDTEAFFERHVRPLLVARCYQCHAGDKAGGGLSLETRTGTRRGGDGGAAVVPGRPDESLLIAAVSGSDPDWRMPPEDAGPPLTPDEVGLLRAWIVAGAFDPREASARIGGMDAAAAADWWAFQPLGAATGLPTPDAIDARLDASLAARGLEVAPPADDRTFIRRATYDLIGLPPASDDVDAFLADGSSGKDARLIERLLASPDYGVQQGRRWLDVVRYADTAGENTDRPLPHAWRYRNWVFEAVNRDLPYPDFIRLQIAGDLVAATADRAAREEGIVATGYLAIARRFGHDIDKDIHLTHEDVIDNLGKTFLGLTIGCARCHDHKYDPVSSRDYYALYGIFDSTRFSFPGCEPKGAPRDLVPLMSADEIKARMAPWRERRDAYNAAVAAAKERSGDAPPEALPPEPGPEPVIPVAYAVAEREPRDAPLQVRGEPDKPGDVVPRRWLEVFGGPPVPPDAGSGRRELAAWIATSPLAARVIVNRVWQWHFGSGLVRTPNDFGSRGERPTHPELLDMLAAGFVAEGGRLKPLHRAIMATRAYRRASAASDELVAADPDNRWLARFSRRRLTAEEIRDTLLVASAELDRTPGEAHPFPPEATWKFTQHVPFNAVYDTTRRSAFLMVQRQRRHPFLALFDGADPNTSTPVRQTTTVPTQALYFLNDPFFHDRAAGLARRLGGSADEGARIVAGYRIAYQRPPSAAEAERAARFIAAYPGPADDRWAAWARVLLASNELLHVD